MNSQNILNNPQTPQIHPPTSQPLTTSHASERLNLNDKKQAFQSYYSKINPFVFSQDLIEIAPQIKTLEKLLEYENKIDKILSKKRVDIQEQLLRPFPKIKRILRVHVYNTYNIMEEPPSWTLRIEGKLLNNEKNVNFIDPQNNNF